MSGQRYSRRQTMRMLAAAPAFSAATRPWQGRATVPRTRSVRLGGPLPGPGRGAPAPDARAAADGLVDALAGGLVAAREAIDSGAAGQALDRWIELSQQLRAG